MSLLNLILNVLWILTGGVWMALGWLIAAVIMAITIIGLPWARAAFNIAVYTFLPFGYVAMPRDEVEGREDLGTGPLGVIGNIIWLVLAGWWLALGHLITAVGDHADRDPVRLGAPQAHRDFPVADRQDNRERRRGVAAAGRCASALGAVALPGGSRPCPAMARAVLSRCSNQSSARRAAAAIRKT